VSYANTFLRGRSYDEVKRTGRLSMGFATDPCRAIFKRVQTMFSSEMPDNCNVNVGRIGERYVAMTETPIPIEFDAETLATMGHAPEAPGQLTTAHPHHDRERDEAVNYAVRFGPRSTYRVYARAAGEGSPRQVAQIPVNEPAYMHSFGMTERFVVLAEFPLVVNPLRLALGARAFIENYRWKPERGTRFLVIDRHDGSVRMRATAEPFFCFHHVNAFEEGDDVVVDLVAYEDSQIIQALYLDAMRASDATFPRSVLKRYRVRPGEERIEGELLSDQPIELPRIDYGRRNARPYRYVYGAGQGDPWFEELVKIDIETRAVLSWREPGCYPGEPVFVARPGGEREDDGALLSVVLDARSGRSFMLVLDAGSLEELARAEVPHHVPHSFHGQFFRG
jgi:beta,beta-carotene 9',10'-dioxygenase